MSTISEPTETFSLPSSVDPTPPTSPRLQEAVEPAERERDSESDRETSTKEWDDDSSVATEEWDFVDDAAPTNAWSAVEKTEEETGEESAATSNSAALLIKLQEEEDERFAMSLLQEELKMVEESWGSSLADDPDGIPGDGEFDCPLCRSSVTLAQAIIVPTCGCIFCRGCLAGFVRNSVVLKSMGAVHCPQCAKGTGLHMYTGDRYPSLEIPISLAEALRLDPRDIKRWENCLAALEADQARRTADAGLPTTYLPTRRPPPTHHEWVAKRDEGAIDPLLSTSTLTLASAATVNADTEHDEISDEEASATLRRYLGTTDDPVESV